MINDHFVTVHKLPKVSEGLCKFSPIWFILKVLGHFAVDEMYLNNITSSHFGEEKARKVYAEFKRGLDKVVSILSENSIRSIFSAGGERNRREKREAGWRRQDPVHRSSTKEDPDRHSSVIFGRMFQALHWLVDQPHDLMHCPIISLSIWSDCCLLCRSKCEEIYCPLLSAPIIFLFDLNSHRLVTKILLTSSE